MISSIGMDQTEKSLFHNIYFIMTARALIMQSENIQIVKWQSYIFSKNWI